MSSFSNNCVRRFEQYQSVAQFSKKKAVLTQITDVKVEYIGVPVVGVKSVLEIIIKCIYTILSSTKFSVFLCET